MADQRPSRPTEMIVYYKGRASGLAPLLSSIKLGFFIALSLVAYWLLNPGTRQELQQRLGEGFVAESLAAFENMEYSKPAAEIIRLGLLAFGCLLLLRILWIWMGWNATNYLVTNERIQYERGVLAKTIKTIDLWRVRDLIFQRSMIEAFFGLGSVMIVANDPTSRYSTIGPVVRARRLYDDLMDARAIAIRERGVSAVES